MSGQQDHKLQVVEILHYVNDVDTALDFYHGKLGWPVIWHAPGNMATIDTGGVYQLTVIAAKWIDGWTPGLPVRSPRLALQSLDLYSDADVLKCNGLTGIEVTGDPKDMLMATFTDPAGIEVFIWQDGEGNPATEVANEYRSNRKPEPIYTLGECLFFVNDKPVVEAFYTDILGFKVTSRHGDVFTGLQIGDGPVLGIYHWPDWWDKPTEPDPDAPVRLFLECPSIADEYARNKAAGIEPSELKISTNGLHWFTLTDPDGNAMTFWQFKP